MTRKRVIKNVLILASIFVGAVATYHVQYINAHQQPIGNDTTYKNLLPKHPQEQTLLKDSSSLNAIHTQKTLK